MGGDGHGGDGVGWSGGESEGVKGWRGKEVEVEGGGVNGE